MKESIVFKPRSRLLLQLGDQLIKNESIALLELVKNSYDADATEVRIKMRKVDIPNSGTITIEDNGSGMDLDLIRDVWMEPGSDYKEKLYINKVFSSKFRRLPIGEKGIGRFGVHKLGSLIELVSRKSDRKEVYLRISWDDFEEPRYLHDIPINIYERKPEVFTNGRTGTRIEIKKLKRPWNRGMVREVYRSLNALCSPFDAPDSFVVDFDIDRDEWLAKLLSWQEVRDYSLFSVFAEMEGTEITGFEYSFTPWPSMKKLQTVRITEKSNEIIKLKEMVDRDNELIDLSLYRIGKVKFQAYIFDRDTRILSLGVQDKRGLKEYLDTNGGIRVYRDGIRIYDYGEPGNDWLDLGTRRINIPTKRISNNLIIGAVNLSRRDSRDLVEKTNREGFVENEAYKTLRSAVTYVLSLVETFRGMDKEKLRIFYGPTPVSEPVISSINELRDVVEKRIKDEKIKDEVSLYLKRIEDEYKRINEILLRSAGAGLSLSVVIHEVEKIVGELKRVINKERPSGRIINLIKHLSQLIEGYSVIIKNTGNKAENIKILLDQAIFNIEFRLEVHRISVIKQYSVENGDYRIKCARNLIIGAVLNIIDNSIYWLERAGVKEKKIYLSVSDEMPGYISVIIADNGPGFALPTEEITKPFVSAKVDGMGLGLHIAREVMEVHGGQLIFPDWSDFSIPSEYKNGAIVVMAFKKKEASR